jgi:phosphate transport system substrate-binding protein
LAGSTAATLALHDLTQAYSQRHPNVVFDLRGGGSTLAEEWIARGEYDLVISSLLEGSGGEDAGDATPATPVPPGTATASADAPTLRAAIAASPSPTAQLVRTPIALDGLAIVVHPSNEVTSLTLLQLRDLFRGQTLTWRDVGGSDEDVQVVSREEGSGARVLFEERVMGDAAVSLTAIVMPTHADVVEYVAANPQAIGYVSRGYVTEEVAAAAAGEATDEPEADPAARIVAIDGVYPTIEQLRNQTYPLVYPLYLISRGAPRGVALQFIEFVLSPAGQEIVGRYHASLR